MISQTVEYALRAVAMLACEPDQPRTAQQLSEGTKVPKGYLPKVLQPMVRAGLLTAQRGLHGGFALAWPPDQITMLDVVDAVDPLKRIENCPLGIPSHVKLCPLHRRLDDAIGIVEDAFASTTIASLLVERKGESKPLCDLTVDGEPVKHPLAGRGKRSTASTKRPGRRPGTSRRTRPSRRART